MHKLKKGILIAIEGIDGSGKSTLANNLRDHLIEKDLDVLLTYEPGDTPLGKQLRKILHERNYDICGKAEFLLFAADRAQHFKEIIIPNLEKNKIIISDRMSDSSVVYQGYGRQEDIKKIQEINAWVMQNRKPDITFYIKVPLELALQRLQKRKSKPTSFEKEEEKFTRRLITGFEEIFKNRKNFITLDGTETPDILIRIAYKNIMLYIEKIHDPQK